MALAFATAARLACVAAEALVLVLLLLLVLVRVAGADFLAAAELRLADLLAAAFLREAPVVFWVDAGEAAVVGAVAAKVVMAWLISREAARVLLEVRRVGAGGEGRDADAERELMERSFCLSGPIACVTRL